MVVLTAYPLCSSIFTSAEAMYPFPPVTHAVLTPPVDGMSAVSGSEVVAMWW